VEYYVVSVTISSRIIKCNLFFQKKEVEMRKKKKRILYILDRGVQGRGSRGHRCVKLHIVDFQNLHHFGRTMLEDERRNSSTYLQ